MIRDGAVYRSADHGIEEGLALATRKLAETDLVRAVVTDGQLLIRRRRPVVKVALLILVGSMAALVTWMTLMIGESWVATAAFGLITSACFGAVYVLMTRSDLRFCHRSVSGTDVMGLRVGLRTRAVARILLERDATEERTASKLVIVTEDGGRIQAFAFDIAGGRQRSARMKLFAVALAAWLGKSVEIDESQESASRMRKADKAEGLDVRGVPRLREPRELRSKRGGKTIEVIAAGEAAGAVLEIVGALFSL